jgi:hypothetical protein
VIELEINVDEPLQIKIPPLLIVNAPLPNNFPAEKDKTPEIETPDKKVELIPFEFNSVPAPIVKVFEKVVAPVIELVPVPVKFIAPLNVIDTEVVDIIPI